MRWRYGVGALDRNRVLADEIREAAMAIALSLGQWQRPNVE
jgi:hypothetical protein